MIAPSCGRVGFKPTAEFGVHHWPSFLDVVFLHEPGFGSNGFRCPPPAERAR